MINGRPLIVCLGRGVDSWAILVGLHQRGVCPDLIIFADVGAERPETYHQPELEAWLEEVGFPKIVTVRYVAKNFKHWPHYHTIEENILTNVSLPAIAYGGHSCSSKWKISAINAWIHKWPVAIECWARGDKLIKAIGFEDSPHEHKRAERGCATFNVKDDEKDKYELWFPLQEWEWDRDRCKVEIGNTGRPVPMKSSCYFCTAMKTHEVDSLGENQLKRIVVVEARTAPQHLEFAQKKHQLMKTWLQDPAYVDQKNKIHKRTRDQVMTSLKRMSLQPNGPYTAWKWNGRPMTEGLWRSTVKGLRKGSTAKPGSMTQYIREKGLLPAAEIDRLIAATPTQFFTQADLEKLGIKNWQEWLQRICYPEKA